LQLSGRVTFVAVQLVIFRKERRMEWEVFVCDCFTAQSRAKERMENSPWKA
jgi:hypothetical protein